MRMFKNNINATGDAILMSSLCDLVVSPIKMPPYTRQLMIYNITNLMLYYKIFILEVLMFNKCLRCSFISIIITVSNITAHDYIPVFMKGFRHEVFLCRGLAGSQFMRWKFIRKNQDSCFFLFPQRKFICKNMIALNDSLYFYIL